MNKEFFGGLMGPRGNGVVPLHITATSFTPAQNKPMPKRVIFEVERGKKTERTQPSLELDEGAFKWPGGAEATISLDVKLFCQNEDKDLFQEKVITVKVVDADSSVCLFKQVHNLAHGLRPSKYQDVEVSIKTPEDDAQMAFVLDLDTKAGIAKLVGSLGEFIQAHEDRNVQLGQGLLAVVENADL